jgi:hypothetical protein
MSRTRDASLPWSSGDHGYTTWTTDTQVTRLKHGLSRKTRQLVPCEAVLPTRLKVHGASLLRRSIVLGLHASVGLLLLLSYCYGMFLGLSISFVGSCIFVVLGAKGVGTVEEYCFITASERRSGTRRYFVMRYLDGSNNAETERRLPNDKHTRTTNLWHGRYWRG